MNVNETQEAVYLNMSFWVLRAKLLCGLTHI